MWSRIKIFRTLYRPRFLKVMASRRKHVWKIFARTSCSRPAKTAQSAVCIARNTSSSSSRIQVCRCRMMISPNPSACGPFTVRRTPPSVRLPCSAVRRVQSLVRALLLAATIIGTVRGDQIRQPSVFGGEVGAAVGGLRPRGNGAGAPVNASYDQILETSRYLNHNREIFVPAGTERQPTHVGVGIRITHPPKYSVFIVGDVVVNFETLGFVPSEASPVEVLVPQNGETPFLVENGDAVKLSALSPCTLQVTLSATVSGQRASSSVIFSMVLDEAAVLLSRWPLPPDALWGIPTPVISSTLVRDFEDDAFGVDAKDAACILEEERNRAAKDMEHLRLRAGSARGAGEKARDVTSPREPPNPLSLLFVGSVSLDGQKQLWLHQMERLPRSRFSVKYLSFQPAPDVGEGRIDVEATNWKTTAADIFEQRLLRAGVHLMKAAAPRVQAGWASFERSDDSDGYATHTATADKDAALDDIEAVNQLVLESFDRAGGKPHLMSPLWAREAFEGIAKAIENISPGITIFANGKTLGDAVLTRAARWAMGERGRIVMDVPNMDPAEGIIADVLAAPSHYVARDFAVRALAIAAGAHVVVIPPGANPVAPSSHEEFGAEVAAGNNVLRGSLCHPACGHGTVELGQCNLACHVSHIKVIGFVGRLSPEKSPGLFLQVASLLLELFPCARFVVVGDGPLKPVLEIMARELGIGRLHGVVPTLFLYPIDYSVGLMKGSSFPLDFKDPSHATAGPRLCPLGMPTSRRVHFAGWVGGSELQHLLLGMDLLFNPSLIPETFCMVNIEAMAVGTPIAAFGTGGMLEYLSPENALILDDPDPLAAATAIGKVLLDPLRLGALAERGQRDVLNKFRTDTAVERWAQLYEALGRGWGSTTRTSH